MMEQGILGDALNIVRALQAGQHDATTAARWLGQLFLLCRALPAGSHGWEALNRAYQSVSNDLGLDVRH